MKKRKRNRTTNPIAFWAYPSSPINGAEAMRNAAIKVARANPVQTKTWEDCKVGGKIIIGEICNQIRGSAIFIADITGINPNVMFELGFAIGARKRIWLLLDSSKAEAVKKFNEFRLLTTIGYASYTNSNQIVEKIAAERPWDDLTGSVLQRSKKTPKRPDSRLLYLKSRYESEAGLQFSEIIERSGLPIIVDDPLESPVQTFSWYANQVEEAFAVAAHFTSMDHDGAELYNARHAFVAGMAFALDHRLLLLAPESYESPIDYRELMVRYREASRIEALVNPWLVEAAIIYQSEVASLGVGSLPLTTGSLAGIRIGDPVAENEEATLIDEYFISTAAFEEVLRPSVTMFVGRKGAGKTANLLKASAVLNADKRNLVCIVKPPSYELAALTEVLGSLRKQDSQGFAVESFWKYLIYSEIAIAVVGRIKTRLSKQINANEEALMKFVSDNADELNKSFAVRLELTSRRLLNAIESSNLDENDIESFRSHVAEALHKGPLRNIRKAICEAYSTGGQIAVLIDNLDKSWDRKGDVAPTASVILGLLSAVHRLSDEFRAQSQQEDLVRVGVSVFVRSDILFHLKNQAREPDKISISQLAWDDAEALSRILDKRLMVASGAGISANEAWRAFFESGDEGIAAREYIVQRCLPRPRDLVYFAKAAIAKAVDRNHSRVTSKDLFDAETDYSYFALQTALVEGQARIPNLDDVLLEFAGCREVLTKPEVEKILCDAGLPTVEQDKATEELLFLNFLGIELGNDDARYLTDRDHLRKLIILDRKHREGGKSETNYRIHPAFHAYLEISST